MSSPKRSELNSSEYECIFKQFWYFSKNTIVYKDRVMSQYSAHFILTLRLFWLFIDCIVTLYRCFLVSLFKVCFGSFSRINACLLKLTEASVDQAAQADVFEEGLPLFGVIFSFWRSMICVSAKRQQEKDNLIKNKTIKMLSLLRLFKSHFCISLLQGTVSADCVEPEVMPLIMINRLNVHVPTLHCK